MLVAGEQGKDSVLQNNSFQGTVLGPLLWLVFFADSREPVRASGFEESFFVDDLHAYQEDPRATPDEVLLQDAYGQ